MYMENEELLIDMNSIHEIQRFLMYFEMLSEIEKNSLEEISIISISIC